jgi:hypothetical protein
VNGTTSDGIPAKAWARIHELALRYANSVEADRRDIAERVRRQMLRALNDLQSRFGKRPSILATKGEYVKRTSQRRRLLLSAFDAAKRRGDVKNLTLISSSLAELFADEAPDSRQAQKWVIRLEESLAKHFDRTEAAVLRSLKGRSPFRLPVSK